MVKEKQEMGGEESKKNLKNQQLFYRPPVLDHTRRKSTTKSRDAFTLKKGSTSLWGHMKLHENNQFVCSICGATFKGETLKNKKYRYGYLVIPIER
jgi:hypothetical protein